jgi:fibronectin type 3 domain-containing protein
VSQSDTNIVLTWTNPEKYVDGSNATDLTNALVRQDGKLIASVPVSGPGKQQTYSQIVSDNLKTPTFTVEIETQRGKTSALSKQVHIAIVEVPGAVMNLKGVMDQHRIQLDWEPPAENPALAEVYLIRRDDGPSDPVAVTETHWEDRTVEAGKTYSYVVTAARQSVPPVSGPPGPKVTVIAIDKKPPAAPSGVQPPVISDSGAILRWDRSTEEDWAGYKVYRSENPAAGDRGWMLLVDELLTITSFTDASYRPGSYYSVTALDDSGNESERSSPVRAP